MIKQTIRLLGPIFPEIRWSSKLLDCLVRFFRKFSDQANYLIAWSDFSRNSVTKQTIRLLGPMLAGNSVTKQTIRLLGPIFPEIRWSSKLLDCLVRFFLIFCDQAKYYIAWFDFSGNSAIKQTIRLLGPIFAGNSVTKQTIRLLGPIFPEIRGSSKLLDCLVRFFRKFSDQANY